MSPAARFETVDLALAAWLYAKGHAIEVTELSPSQRQFSFPLAAEEDAETFYKGGAMSARMYYAALRDVKSMLYRPARPSGGAR